MGILGFLQGILSKELLTKIGVIAATLFAVWLLLGGFYLAGQSHGEHKIQTAWNQDKATQHDEIVRLQGVVSQKEAAHRQESQAVAEQLRKTEVQYEETRSALAAEHAQRLRLSSERGAIYERLAQGDATERGGLASHAAGLDRALEEGVGLVGELQAALGQREAQLRLLGEQILNDRKLLDGQ